MKRRPLQRPEGTSIGAEDKRAKHGHETDLNEFESPQAIEVWKESKF
jgi:hypothetical protein